jgi:hypothetical protein
VITVSIHGPGPSTTRRATSSGVSDSTSMTAAVSSWSPKETPNRLPLCCHRGAAVRSTTVRAIDGGDQFVDALLRGVDADEVNDVGHCSVRPRVTPRRACRSPLC